MGGQKQKGNMKTIGMLNSPAIGMGIGFALWGIGWDCPILISIGGSCFVGWSLANYYAIVRD